MTKSEWLSHEKQRKEAGLNKRTYCRKFGIKPHKYHYYQKKYKPEVISSPKLAEVIVDKRHGVGDFSITIELTDQGGVRFYGHADNLRLFHQKLLSLTNEKSA